MEDKKRGSIIDSIIKYLIIFNILLVSFIVATFIVATSIIKKEFDLLSITVGIVFIFMLIFLKWVIKEIEM